MTGNVALDIFIGIVFVYLLYSLLATIIMEIIATFLGLRARNLNYALKRMLKDEDENKKEYNWFVKFFRGIWTSIISTGGWSINLNPSDLYDKFIEQPTIKYLSSGSIFSKPSYITSENFAKALVDTLKGDSGEANLLERIKTGFAGLPVSSDTRKHLESLMEDANNDIQKFRLKLENWFDDTMKRTTGWYKKNNQMFLLIIGFILAVALNANTFHIISKLSKDEKAREQLVLLSTSYLKENQDIITNLDSLKKSDAEFAIKIDTLLSIREDLQKDINKANSIISVSWPRMDSIKIDSVSGENAARQMIPIGKKDSKIGICYPANVDKALFEKALIKDKYNYVCLKEDSSLWKSVLEYIWYRPNADKALKKSKYYYVCFKDGKSFWNKVFKHFWYPANDYKALFDKALKKGNHDYVYFRKNKYLWSMVGKNFLGYLVTALFISLGAPFWFDLLNKIVKLRTSVAQNIGQPVVNSTEDSNEIKG